MEEAADTCHHNSPLLHLPGGFVVFEDLDMGNVVLYVAVPHHTPPLALRGEARV